MPLGISRTEFHHWRRSYRAAGVESDAGGQPWCADASSDSYTRRLSDLPVALPGPLARRLAAAFDVEGKIPRALDALGPLAGRTSPGWTTTGAARSTG